MDQGPTLRRSERVRRSAISDEFLVYLQEDTVDRGDIEDPVSFSQAMKSEKSTYWFEVMKEKLDSIAKNQV